MTKRSKTFRKTILDTFKQIDMFGEGVGFQFEGSSTYKTLFGAILSWSVFGLIILYAHQKLTDMFERTDTNYQTFSKEGGIDDRQLFPFEESRFMHNSYVQDFGSP